MKEIDKISEYLAKQDASLIEEVNNLMLNDKYPYDDLLKNVDKFFSMQKGDEDVLPSLCVKLGEYHNQDGLVAMQGLLSKAAKIDNAHLGRFEGEKRVIDVWRDEKGLKVHSITDEKVLLKLKSMGEIAKNIASLNQHIEKEMTHYATEVLSIIAQEPPEKQAEEIMELTKGVAEKFSMLPEKDILSQSKALAKDIIAAQGKKDDVFYSIKEGCKWMLNKLTFGLTEKTASQKIDSIFKELGKNKIIDVQRSQENNMVSDVLDDVFGENKKKINQKNINLNVDEAFKNAKDAAKSDIVSNEVKEVKAMLVDFLDVGEEVSGKKSSFAKRISEKRRNPDTKERSS